jgi:hypothetical protein
MGEVDPSARTPSESAAAVPHIGDAARHAQAFPSLTAREIDRIRRFGTLRHYGPGEAMFVTGAPSLGQAGRGRDRRGRQCRPLPARLPCRQSRERVPGARPHAEAALHAS